MRKIAQSNIQSIFGVTNGALGAVTAGMTLMARHKTTATIEPIKLTSEFNVLRRPVELAALSQTLAQKKRPGGRLFNLNFLAP